jgi:hypothetical protein
MRDCPADEGLAAKHADGPGIFFPLSPKDLDRVLGRTPGAAPRWAGRVEIRQGPLGSQFDEFPLTHPSGLPPCHPVDESGQTFGVREVDLRHFRFIRLKGAQT